MFVVLLACSGKGQDSEPMDDPTESHPTTSTDDSDPPTTIDCGIDLVGVRPVANTDAAYAYGDLEFHFDAADPSATVTSLEEGSDGLLRSGSERFSEDGRILYFSPDEPLLPNTEYRATIQWCAATQPIPFTTSDLGTAMKSPAKVQGQSYALDMSKGRFVEPPGGLDGLVPLYLEHTLRLHVDSAGDDFITLSAASIHVSGGGQDVCLPTDTFTAANFTSNPYFSAENGELTVSLAGAWTTLTDLTLSGAFPQDGGEIGWVALQGIWDTRPFDEPYGGDGSVCAAAEKDGRSCFACDDGKPYCLRWRVDEMTAEPVGQGFETVKAACLHSSCVAKECK